jgi:hypothetical protein
MDSLNICDLAYIDTWRLLVGNCYHDDSRLRRRHAHWRMGKTRRDALRYRRRANNRPSGSGRRRQLQQLLSPRFRICFERIIAPTRARPDHLHTYQRLRRVIRNDTSLRANVKLPLAPYRTTPVRNHSFVRPSIFILHCRHAPAVHVPPSQVCSRNGDGACSTRDLRRLDENDLRL